MRCNDLRLAGKADGIDGGKVEKYFHEGRIKEIAEYCEGDVVNTYRVWLRYELFRGKLNDAGFQSRDAARRARSSATRRIQRLPSLEYPLRGMHAESRALERGSRAGNRNRVGLAVRSGSPLVARVRHLNDKKKPDHWRAA